MSFKTEGATQYLVIGAGGYGLGVTKQSASMYWYQNTKPHNYEIDDGRKMAVIYETDASVEVDGMGYIKADVLEEVGSLTYHEGLSDFFESMYYVAEYVNVWGHLFSDTEVDEVRCDEATVLIDELGDMMESGRGQLMKMLGL